MKVETHSSSSRTRIDVLLAKSYDPDPRVRRTVEALIGVGYDVRVLAWDRTGKRPPLEYDGPIPIRRIHVRSRGSRGWTQIFFLTVVAFRLLPIIRRRRPAVLHAVNLPMLAVAILMAPFIGRPRIVYDAFEIHALMGAHRYSPWLLAVIGWIERYLPRLADLVITPGEDRRRYFAELGIESIAVPNWIDPPSAVPGQAEARARLGIDPDRFTILYAGGFLRSRDIQPLIDRAARRPEDLVLIAGRGDTEEELARAASGMPNVRLLGWVPEPADLLAASDALYYALRPDHPYAAHAAPNNLYQAVAYGIPLVYREQGEIAVVAAEHEIGRGFYDQATLDLALDELEQPAINAAVRGELRALQTKYRWSRAKDVLIEGYRRLTWASLTAESREPSDGLIVLTRIWPSRERPSVGSFVQARVSGVTGIKVVRPRWAHLPRMLLYLVLLLDSLRVRGSVRGVEAHMLIPTGFVGLIAARLRGVPVVVYSHGSDVREWRRLPRMLRFISRLVATRADAVVTNSMDTAEHLRALGREPVVIPPGVDLRRFAPTPRPANRSVLYVGGRTAGKGYAIAQKLADTLVGPSLLDVEPRDMPSLMAAHHVVLMPSTAEAFGLAAVEAIASGRWVVANAVGGLREIVIDGVNGTLVTDGDYASAIARVPDYDPFEIARTVERFSLIRWQEEMDAVWSGLGVARARAQSPEPVDRRRSPPD